MIYINAFANKKLKELDFENMYIITDFDRTLTLGTDDTTWGIASKTNLLSSEYPSKRNELFKDYYPIERSNIIPEKEKFPIMKEWWEKHMSLLIGSGITQEIEEKLVYDFDFLNLRHGAADFLKTMYECNVPVIIMSAGIYSFIENLLKKHNCMFDNIYIIANKIIYKNNLAAEFDKHIIHSLNKNECELPEEILETVKNRKQVLLFGDNLSDVNMVSEEKRTDTLRVGFLRESEESMLPEYKKVYDIVCTKETSYTQLFDVINRK